MVTVLRGGTFSSVVGHKGSALRDGGRLLCQERASYNMVISLPLCPLALVHSLLDFPYVLGSRKQSKTARKSGI
jgi:hypothetical protein